jgi:hypothetical protein
MFSHFIASHVGAKSIQEAYTKHIDILWEFFNYNDSKYCAKSAASYLVATYIYTYQSDRVYKAGEMIRVKRANKFVMI